VWVFEQRSLVIGPGAVSSRGDQGRLLVVGVGKVHAGGGDVVEPPAVAGHRLRHVDDMQDFGPAKRVICTARMTKTLGDHPGMRST
jgi:hypothetical protein